MTGTEGRQAYYSKQSYPCIRYFSVAVIEHHDLMQIIERRVYLSLWF